MIAALKAWLKRNNKHIEQATQLAVALIATFAAVFLVTRIAFLENMDRFVADFEIGFLPPVEPQDPDIVVVAVNEDTLAQFPYRSPLDRGFLNNLLTTLAARGPRAIGIDYLLDQATEPAKDDALKKTLRTLKVPLVVAYTDDPNIETPQQLAVLNSFVPPRLRAYVTLGEDDLNIARWVYPGGVTRSGHYLAAFSPAIAAKAGAKPRITEHMPIAWHGQPSPDVPAFKQFPAHVAQFLPPQWFKNKIILIGSDLTLAGGIDRHHTPFDVVDPHGLGNMAGVVIQAHVLSQLLHGRSPPNVPWWVNVLIVFLCAAAGARLGALNISLFGRVLAGLGVVVLLWAGGIGLFYKFGMLIGLITPTLAMGLALWATESLTGREARRQREFIQGAFSRYVSPKVVEQLVADPSKMSLEGERRVMTYLFTDIADFTTMSEGLESRELGRMLNEYLEGMTQCVLKRDGMVDKFIGDAVFAIFNAPVDLPDHAEQAVLCALEMDKFAYAYSRQQQARGINFGITRIGVHTGAAFVGNFGSREKFNYTAQGDAVNTASRLEGLNKLLHSRIAVSDATRQLCRTTAFRPIGEVVLKGKTKAIEVWEPLPDGDPRLRYLDRYSDLYAKLKINAPEARELLDRLAQEEPEDTCVALHKSRIARGESGVNIIMTEK